MTWECTISEAAEEIFHAPSLEAISASLTRVASSFGYGSFLLSDVPNPQQRLTFTVLLSGWPPGWLEHYCSNDYVRIDPVARQIAASADSFHWQDATSGRALTARQRQVMGEAADCGMPNGFCVPVHGPRGALACISFGGKRRRLDPHEMSQLNILGRVALSRARLRRGKQQAAQAAGLTARQMEVLPLVDLGKTNAVIGQILGITERTANKHVTDLMTKLGAANRMEAAAEARRRGIIP